MESLSPLHPGQRLIAAAGMVFDVSKTRQKFRNAATYSDTLGEGGAFESLIGKDITLAVVQMQFEGFMGEGRPSNTSLRGISKEDAARIILFRQYLWDVFDHVGYLEGPFFTKACEKTALTRFLEAAADRCVFFSKFLCHKLFQNNLE